MVLAGLAYWNDWTNGLYYINDDHYYTVQVFLMNIQRQMEAMKSSAQSGMGVGNLDLPSNSVRMAVTVMCVLPVLVAYVFLQKYFVKGIAVGAVKG